MDTQEELARRRALVVGVVRRSGQIARTKLIRLSAAVCFGPYSHQRCAMSVIQRSIFIPRAIRQAVAEGDIVEVPLACPGTCAYRLQEGLADAPPPAV